MDGNIEKMQSLTGKIKSLAIDTTLTKKGMCAEAKSTGEALATKVNITDIVDDLTSVADDKPLSANQGRVLKKQIDEIDPHYAENVNYDNTTSGIDADNVQGAIDKLSKAENIAYDEEKSVQGAIDELNTNVADVQTQLDTKANVKNLTYSKLVEANSTHINKPWLVIKDKWAEIPLGMCCIDINCASAYGALVYKLNDNYGKVYIFNYGGTVDYITRKTANGWSFGSTSVGSFTDF